MTLVNALNPIRMNVPAALELEWEPLGKSAAVLPGETLEYSAPIHTYRAFVPGGWMVLVLTDALHSSLAFYPDPYHEWDGTTQRKHPLR